MTPETIAKRHDVMLEALTNIEKNWNRERYINIHDASRMLENIRTQLVICAAKLEVLQ